jgi:hypothetical protein
MTVRFNRLDKGVSSDKSFVWHVVGENYLVLFANTDCSWFPKLLELWIRLDRRSAETSSEGAFSLEPASPLFIALDWMIDDSVLSSFCCSCCYFCSPIVHPPKSQYIVCEINVSIPEYEQSFPLSIEDHCSRFFRFPSLRRKYN